MILVFNFCNISVLSIDNEIKLYFTLNPTNFKMTFLHKLMVPSYFGIIFAITDKLAEG